MINLGDKVRDRVTGFTGIATGRHEYLNGCVRYSIDPPVNDKGEMVDGRLVDVQQLELIESGAFQVAVDAAPARAVGGPRSSIPPSRR